MTENYETTILVTGATGTVGSEVVKQLLSSSSSSGRNNIKASVHSQNKADEFKRNNKAVEVVNMDYNKPETIAAALNNVDKLFWLTLPTPNMTEISSGLVKEAKKNPVNHIVKLSVMAADAEPGTIIGRLHRQEEKIIEDSGIPYTFLRAGAFMQNFVNFFGQTIKNQNAFYLPAGNGRVSFVDVGDIAATATEILLTKGSTKRSQLQYENKAYDVTGPNAISYSQAAEILSNNLGRRITYVDISEEDARKAMKGTGMEDWLIDGVMEFYNIIRAGYASQTTNTIEQILGRKPISFEQFVKDHVNSFN